MSTSNIVFCFFFASTHLHAQAAPHDENADDAATEDVQHESHRPQCHAPFTVDGAIPDGMR